MLGVIGIILSLALLMVLAYKGWPVILLAPVLALLAASFALLAGGSVHLLATYTEVFMVNAANYVKSYYPIFLLGAIFGKVMDDAGIAKSIAHYVTNKLGTGKEIWALALAGGIITYGGVSMFVAAFALYPIGAALFRNTGIPKKFLPATIAIGVFTYSMTAIPGSPQIQNAIPMKYLGTDLFAAPVLGFIAGIIMLVLSCLWITKRVKSAIAKGEGYGDHPNEELRVFDDRELPSFGSSMVPILIVLIGNLVFSKWVMPRWDTAYLKTEFGVDPATVLGTWSLIVSLVLGIAAAVILNYGRIKSVKNSLWGGVTGSFLAIMNTASEVGYGNVIKTLAGFTIVAGALMGISGNVLINDAIISSTLAGITGSASGGMSIALETFGPQLLAQASEAGISPEVLHRVTSVAAGGLDTLPHNGAIITLLAITGMTHRESYKDIAVITVAIPLLAAVIIIVLGSFGLQ